MRETSTILTERKRCDERLALKGGESYKLQASGFRLQASDFGLSLTIIKSLLISLITLPNILILHSNI
jgi:hypothetical protein